MILETEQDAINAGLADHDIRHTLAERDALKSLFRDSTAYDTVSLFGDFKAPPAEAPQAWEFDKESE